MNAFQQVTLRFKRFEVGSLFFQLGSWFISILLSCHVAFAEEVAAKKSDPQVVTLRLLAKALSDDAPSLNEEAEQAFNATETELAGANKTLALYGMILLKLRDEEYEDADGLIAKMSEKAIYSAPVLRARCYLAMQKGNKTESKSCLKSLLELVKNDSANQLDRTETAFYLGAISILLENIPQENRIVSIAPLIELQSSFETANLTELRLAHKQGREAAIKRAEELRKTFELVSKRGVEDSKADFAASEKTLAEKQTELQDVSEQAKLQISTHLDATKQDSIDRAKLVKNLATLRVYWGQETPGKPRQPSPPKLNSSKGESKTEEMLNDREYEKDLAAYKDVLREYETALKEWLRKDSQRRSMINQQVEIEQKLIAGLSANAKAREAEKTQIRKQMATIRQEIKEIELQRRLTKAVLNEELTLESLFVPSNFDLITYAAESARLERSLSK